MRSFRFSVLNLCGLAELRLRKEFGSLLVLYLCSSVGREHVE